MPLEKIDPISKARLFIPTPRERNLVASQRALNESLEEVDKMKKELQGLIEGLKENK